MSAMRWGGTLWGDDPTTEASEVAEVLASVQEFGDEPTPQAQALAESVVQHLEERSVLVEEVHPFEQQGEQQ